MCLGAYDEAVKVAVNEKLRISLGFYETFLPDHPPKEFKIRKNNAEGQAIKKMLNAVVVVFINFV